MVPVVDLSDERRALKPWLPADDRDVTTGLVVPTLDGPRCVLHGAMNRVHPMERFYRCSEQRCGVGAQIVPMVAVPGESFWQEHARTCRFCRSEKGPANG